MLKQFPCRRAKSLRSFAHTSASTSSSSSSSMCCSRSLFKFWILHWKMSKCGRLRALCAIGTIANWSRCTSAGQFFHFAILRRLHQLAHSPYFHTTTLYNLHVGQPNVVVVVVVAVRAQIRLDIIYYFIHFIIYVGKLWYAFRLFHYLWCECCCRCAVLHFHHQLKLHIFVLFFKLFVWPSTTNTTPLYWSERLLAYIHIYLHVHSQCWQHFLFRDFVLRSSKPDSVNDNNNVSSPEVRFVRFRKFFFVFLHNNGQKTIRTVCERKSHCRFIQKIHEYTHVSAQIFGKIILFSRIIVVGFCQRTHDTTTLFAHQLLYAPPMVIPYVHFIHIVVFYM